MENEVYQTDDDYSFVEITRVEQWFDRNIGTEVEITEHRDGMYYLMCYEMTPKEVNKARAFELRFGEGRVNVK